MRYRAEAMPRPGRAQFGSGRQGDGWSAYFDRPLALAEAWEPGDVRALVEWIEREAARDRWAILLLSYEAAPAFDAALAVRPPAPGLPLAWAASYAGPEPPRPPAAPGAAVTPLSWRPSVDEAGFGDDIRRVLAHIGAGDTYQVNYTFPLTTDFAGDPWEWFDACAPQAEVPYAACIDLGDVTVMSLSPELFLVKEGRRLRTRPMKGTMRRGRWLAEDERLARDLVESDKARAENVMIVDLLRNDLGRVAETGSVQVRDLCRLERYPTVWQLTSTIEAVARPDVTLFDLLAATFPCGSVTGAPKVRTMEIIADVERAPRGIYTGAVCLLRPGGDLVSSVPIRTAVLDRRTATATFSVGAGITADSVAGDEWAECLAKSRVVRPPAVPDDAALFETMRLEDGAFARRDAHVARLLGSARLFGWPADRQRIDEALEALLVVHPTGLWRARVFLTRTGDVHTDAAPFEPSAQRWRVALAAAPVDVRSPLLFNKTTRRDVYDTARAAAPGVDDVLLWNARGELTEGTVANVVVEIDGVLVTPPVGCGLLPGVFRQELLTDGVVRERVVRVSELVRVSRIWLVNSLREWVDAELVGPP